VGFWGFPLLGDLLQGPGQSSFPVAGRCRPLSLGLCFKGWLVDEAVVARWCQVAVVVC
jgi:hypothetical protein